LVFMVTATSSPSSSSWPSPSQRNGF
jgi:hypothetical protein